MLFLIVKAITRLHQKEQAKENPSVKTCAYCRESVAAEATRCRFCTSELAPV